MPIITRPNAIGAQRNAPLSNDTLQAGGFKVAKCHYDFAVDGGAASTIALTAQKLPVGATVVGGYLDVTTALTNGGGTSTVGLQVQAANDIVNGITIAGAPWSTISKTAIIPVWTFSTWVTVASTAKAPSVVIATTALTAGVFDLYLFWLDTVG